MVGLGNPGDELRGTRHNVGAEAVALVAARQGVRLRRERRLRAEVGETSLGPSRVALAVPLTYMNESGSAVASLVRRFGLSDLDHLVVVHDELDLAPGRVKVKVGGGLAGHNGLKSLRSHLRSADFARVRIGIGKPPGTMAGADYVLRRPSRTERENLDRAVEVAADAVEAVAAGGLGGAMNLYNASDR